MQPSLFRPVHRPFTRLEVLALIAILLAATFFRLAIPGAIEFKQDEANLSLLALDMARGKNFPLLGIDSSVGVRNAPVNVYILVVPYLFTSNPLTATHYIGLLNVLAVFFTYALARRYYGPAPALLAALLLAASPWAIMYSRKIWAQEMLPPFVLMAIGTGLLGFLEGKRWAQVLHLPLLAITGQIHYVTFVLIPISLFLILWAWRHKVLTRFFLLSFPLTLLMIAPYAVGMIQSFSASQAGISRLLGAGGETPTGEARQPITVSTQALHYAWITIAGTEIHSFAGETVYEDYLKRIPDVYGLFQVLPAMVVVAAVWLGIRLARRRDERAPIDAVLLMWLIGVPLAFTVTWTPVYTHYMIPIFPAAVIVLAAALADLGRLLGDAQQRQKRMFALLGFAATAFAAVQIYCTYVLLIFLNDYATPGAFGIPLGHLMDARADILAAKPSQIVGRLDGQFIGYNNDASVWNVLLYDVPLRRFLDIGMEVYPAAETAFFVESGCLLPDATYFARPALDSGAIEACYAVRPRKPTDFDPSAFTPAPENAPRFVNGTALGGYLWDEASGCLATYWVLGNQASGPRSDFFNTAVHFFNAGGDRVAQADSTFWNGRYWRQGDRFMRTFCLTSGQDRLGEIVGVRLGMYTFQDTPEGRQFFGEPLQNLDGTPAQEIEVRFN
jgi:4-amino-4-deoxy-L-arabinose transferase-like glycosyltransferase